MSKTEPEKCRGCAMALSCMWNMSARDVFLLKRCQCGKFTVFGTNYRLGRSTKHRGPTPLAGNEVDLGCRRIFVVDGVDDGCPSCQPLP